jgi:glycosyltransferase involved in cell wall biosynthesis
MKYSFVVIAYNEEENIATCIQSILKQKGLGNSYEIIVVDDGSHDKTRVLVKQLSQSNKKVILKGDGLNHGRGYSRNLGIKFATGDVIAMVDGDIILPKDWLIKCISYLASHSVVGGIAVPDGDVTYLYRKFHFRPKIVQGSTTITGNNGCYKREVFSWINFNKTLREGEDVDFNHRLVATGASSLCIPNLTVEHQEHKSFSHSILWLYQSGVGATRQLIRFREFRNPDLAFLITMIALIFAVVLLGVTGSWIGFIVPVFFVILTSFMHMHSKFQLPFHKFLFVVTAILVDALLISSYYIGRLVGFIVYLRHPPSNQLDADGLKGNA